MIEKSKENEKRFFNRAFEIGSRKPVAKFYAISKSGREYYKKILLSKSYNRKVLEYGCGMGSSAFALARQGAKVVGIDISEVGIKLAKEHAKKEHLDNIFFLVMDGEKMSFKNKSFDIVCGTSILHHLQLDKTLKELTRVLKNDGIAIFIEPLGHNPAINFYRKLTPRLRTREEHPLTIKDLLLIKKFFQKVNFKFFYFFALIAVVFNNTNIFQSILKMLSNFDDKLFEWTPFFRRLAWQIVIILERPKKLYSR